MTLVLFVIAVIFYFFKALISGCKYPCTNPRRSHHVPLFRRF